MSEPRSLAPGARVALIRPVLERTALRLADRLVHLEATLDIDAAAWHQYIATASALAEVLDHLAPGRGGELLTTAEMAGRIGITSKTLLKHKAKGQVRPALQRGKLIRWRGDEVAR